MTTDSLKELRMACSWGTVATQVGQADDTCVTLADAGKTAPHRIDCPLVPPSPRLERSVASATAASCYHPFPRLLCSRSELTPNVVLPRPRRPDPGLRHPGDDVPPGDLRQAKGLALLPDRPHIAGSFALRPMSVHAIGEATSDPTLHTGTFIAAHPADLCREMHVMLLQIGHMLGCLLILFIWFVFFFFGIDSDCFAASFRVRLLGSHGLPPHLWGTQICCL